MSRYCFQVLGHRDTIRLEKSRDMPTMTAVWREVSALAETIGEPGEQLRVTDERGDAIIRIGIASARILARKAASAALRV